MAIMISKKHLASSHIAPKPKTNSWRRHYSFKSPCGCFIFLFPKLRCAHTWAQVPARTILCTAGHHAQGDCGQRRRRPPHARLAAPLARELPDSMPDSWLCIDFSPYRAQWLFHTKLNTHMRFIQSIHNTLQEMFGSKSFPTEETYIYICFLPAQPRNLVSPT